ncbi:hypothetical protein BN6_40970 [Saccharothrix espanaensis DSM 44229]|uniref:Uncharacterized protein n=1 Tax=Saccharothrix espanaensis (strain ATCC 51144 / DSM 44229 / JCM 9112 / NBRC 15066 / NRRL 15764) TaxID=1179773 RepID=K0K3B8_SACES|nr:hypothetical protein BN6_40970 [Saccharothrix espanaensis DSM 44229]
MSDEPDLTTRLELLAERVRDLEDGRGHARPLRAAGRPARRRTAFRNAPGGASGRRRVPRRVAGVRAAEQSG